MIQKFKSRKFLLALLGQVTGLAVLFYPQHTDAIANAITSFGALALMGLTATGWIKIEGQLDLNREFNAIHKDAQ